MYFIISTFLYTHCIVSSEKIPGSQTSRKGVYKYALRFYCLLST